MYCYGGVETYGTACKTSEVALTGWVEMMSLICESSSSDDQEP